MFLPIMLNVKDKSILIVGGGKVAYLKAQKFIEYGAEVKVISLWFDERFSELKGIKCIQEPYDKSYLKNVLLVIAATDDSIVNTMIYRDCQEKAILCNRVDEGIASDFMMPASFSRGELTFAVSTQGKSPSLSKEIIQGLRNEYNEAWVEKVGLLGEIREVILKYTLDEKKELLSQMIHWDTKRLKEYLDALVKEVKR